LIDERFDKISGGPNGATGTTNGHKEPPPTTNGVVQSIEHPPARRVSSNASAEPTTAKRNAPSDESELSEPEDQPKPKKKKTKQLTVEDDDAAYAARLQNEENRNARPTRGGSTRKRAPAKKEKGVTKKKKSAAKVKADDDSDLSSVEDAPKERKGGFHVRLFEVACWSHLLTSMQKLMTLSQPLAELVGEVELSRPQTVKRVWQYIKAHDLQDPSDKRQIICDDMMRRAFKSDKVHMFTMNKILNQNLYPKEE